ncbi:hypothetical protein [Candidatus Formimonas warabiya]|uniref:Uncharacterized protein n=1 Tax=Formimonas warabiya TaxID=1761012 RepID=A0A3G1KP72_FORW1|nr:hypothetical protein [Candidatus Formimonas warabiya]ATW24262.1 hypothetical protein DCMF_05195 [Candidatus Formimonas warabiya]
MGDAFTALGNGITNVRTTLTNISNSINTWIINAVASLAIHIIDVFDRIGEFKEDVSGWFGDVIDTLVSYLFAIKDNIIGMKDSLLLKLSDVWTSLENGFANLANGITNVISYLNPYSENFFVAIAFVPADGWFDDQLGSIMDAFSVKFPAVSEIESSFSDLSDSLTDQSDWQGITINWHGSTVTVVDPTFVNYIAPKIRFWLGGFLILLFGAYSIRKISAMIAGQGGL